MLSKNLKHEKAQNIDNLFFCLYDFPRPCVIKRQTIKIQNTQIAEEKSIFMQCNFHTRIKFIFPLIKYFFFQRT